MIYVSTDNPFLTVDLGEDLRVTVEVTRVGRPARLTGHPDRREPEEPPEWVVRLVEEYDPEAEAWVSWHWLQVATATISQKGEDTITNAVREELW